MTEIDLKKLVGEKASEWVKTDMTIGLGTGSTAYYFILAVARKIKEEGLQIRALTSSDATLQLAQDLNIPLITLDQCDRIDLYVDGADEIDPAKNLIKGRGGAMVQEKILAANSREFIVIADGEKMVSALCSKFPVPVEVLPLAKSVVFRNLKDLGSEPVIRTHQDTNKEIITDQGNIIIDAYFKPGVDPKKLDVSINQIPGVLGHGIFINLATKIITTENSQLKIIS